MTASAVARNYAATLFEIAGREGAESEYGSLIEQVGSLYRTTPMFRRFLVAPAISRAEKKDALARALAGRVPGLFLRFLMVALERRRQGELPNIASAYRDMLDDRAGRVRASVTLPFEAGESLRSEVTAALEERLGKTVIPEFRTDPAILGGVVIRVGDELLDASLKQQLKRMRNELRSPQP